MFLLILLMMLGLILTFGSRWRNRKLIKLSEQLKSDTPCWPLVGHAYKFIGNGEVHMKALEHFGREALKHGGLTSFWGGHFLIVVIADAVDAEYVLKNYLEKGFVMNFIRDLIGNGNVVAPESQGITTRKIMDRAYIPIWRMRRKVLNRMFVPKNLELFEEVFTKHSNTVVQRLESKVGNGPFPIWKYFSTYTLDTICESTLGEDLETVQKNEIVEAVVKGYTLVADRMTRPWQYNSTVYKLFPSYYTAEKLKKFINKLFSKTISDKRKELQKESELYRNDNTGNSDGSVTAQKRKEDRKPKSFRSFIEYLIEATIGDRQYTDKEVQEEMLVLFLAGSDTTAICLSFTAVMLARLPDVQEKVYEELKDVFGVSTRCVTSEDVTKLKFLDAVIKETLRLFNPGPVIVRQSDRDLTLPSGVTIPPDCLLAVNIWAVHRNPKYWGPDAEQFKPERWLDDNTNLKHPAQFLSFSYGSRNCIGYKFVMVSMKILLATMLRRYRIISDTGLTKDGAHKPLRLRFNVSLRDSDDFIVTLEERI